MVYEIDAALFGRIRRMHDRFDALSDRIAEGFANVPPAEGIAEIDAAVAARCSADTEPCAQALISYCMAIRIWLEKHHRIQSGVRLNRH